MINIADTDEICSRWGYQNLFQEGAEGQASEPAKGLPQYGRGANLFGGIAAETPIPKGRMEREATRVTEKAIAYMLQNLDKRIQMSALAALAEVSLSNFYHLFKLATGGTPNDFLIRARIRHACGLLHGTNLRVKEGGGGTGLSRSILFFAHIQVSQRHPAAGIPGPRGGRASQYEYCCSY